MKPLYLFALLCLCSLTLAHAEIYKRVDANGHVTYSSEPLKGGKKLELTPLPVMQAPRSGPKDFPKVDSQTQKNRDSTRRTILEDELATEEKQLAEARQKLKDAEEAPEVFQQTVVVGSKVVGHNKDGSPITQPITETVTRRNVAKYDDKIKAAQDDIATHEQNIQALKTEISNLR